MDAMHLPLPKAAVKVVNLVSEKAMTIETDQKGKFCSSLPEGQYSLEASMTGFVSARYTPITLSYPNTLRLSFLLPLAEINEGGFGPDAIISGTLGAFESPSVGAEICLAAPTLTVPVCTTTNDLGEYALSIRPGKYEVTIRARGRISQPMPLDLPSSGVYRNRLKVDR
jgi:hypothetical protein